jgi:hypothetical protein
MRWKSKNVNSLCPQCPKKPSSKVESKNSRHLEPNLTTKRENLIKSLLELNLNKEDEETTFPKYPEEPQMKKLSSRQRKSRRSKKSKSIEPDNSSHIDKSLQCPAKLTHTEIQERTFTCENCNKSWQENMTNNCSNCPNDKCKDYGKYVFLFECETCNIEWNLTKEEIINDSSCPICQDVKKLRQFACEVCNNWWWRSLNVFWHPMPPLKGFSGPTKFCSASYLNLEPMKSNKEFGWGSFEHTNCGQKFSGHTQMDVPSKCYQCKKMIKPFFIQPIDSQTKREGQRMSDSRHSCKRCPASKEEACPVYGRNVRLLKA